MRSLLLRLAFSLILLLSLPSPALFAADTATVFVYHRFGDNRYPSTNISLEDFRSHLEILRRERFDVLPVGAIVERLRRGDPLPERCAAITVDDAYKSFLTGGVPLLKEFGYPATLFVSTDSVGGQDYLDWPELQVLQREGVEIGNHSATHDYLLDRLPEEDRARWQQRVSADLRQAQEAFRLHLGQAPALLAYPYGEYDPELMAIAREVGFEAALGQQSGVISPASDRFALPRFPMAEAYADAFRSKLLMKPLPVRVLTPTSPVVGAQNPPLLEVQIDLSGIAPGSLRCFVSGQPDGVIDAQQGGAGAYHVQARQPLTGRRSKYTLTARGRDGDWYWFSQLWIRPQR